MTTHRNAIGILGAGRWGTTLAQITARNANNVLLWSRDAELVGHINDARTSPNLPELDALDTRVTATTDLARLAERCRLLILANPADEIRPLARELGEHIDGSHAIVHALRGLEPTTLTTPSQVVIEETCAIQVGAFIGPARVLDLLAGTPNAAVVASRFPQVIAHTRDALACEVLRVYSNRDLLGVEIAAAASSIIAFALGVCLELELGSAAIALLTTRGVAEVSRLVEARGGDPRTAFGLAGLGDILVSRESNGRDTEAGRRYVRGESLETIVGELGHFDAEAAARTLHEYARNHDIEAYITHYVYDALQGNLTVRDGVERLMSVRQMEE